MAGFFLAGQAEWRLNRATYFMRRNRGDQG